MILDSRVASSLDEISKNENWNISIFAKVGRNKYGDVGAIQRYSTGYCKYVNVVNNWAKELIPDQMILNTIFLKKQKTPINIMANVIKQNDVLTRKLVMLTMEIKFS